MNTPRTRTARPHPFLITVASPFGAPDSQVAEFLVEANGSREARAWFAQNMLDIRELSAREVHSLGVVGTPLLDANATQPPDDGQLSLQNLEPPADAAPGDEDE